MLRVSILRVQISRPSWNTASAQRPRTSFAGAKVAASDKDSEPRKEKRVKSKDEDGKKHQKRSSKLYCSLHGENTSHTSRECNVLKAKGKEKPKFSKKDFKKKSREVNLL